MAQVTHNNFNYTVFDEIQVKFPELIELILESESINTPEQKQYWFNMIPAMNNDQIDKLFNILMTERQEIERLDLAFQEEVKKLNEAHMIKFQQLQSQRAKEKIEEAERKDTSKQDAEDILGSLDSL